MIPANFDISYYRGDTYVFYINAKDNEGNDLDLSAYTPSFIIANYRGPDQGGSNPRVAYTATASISGSRITCTISPTIGANLTAGPYVYDVQVANGSANVYTYLTGTISVTLDVSGA